MGQILTCKCKNCGYQESSIHLGGGKIRGYNRFPACHFTEGKVTHIDILGFYEIKNGNILVLNANRIAKSQKEGIVPYFAKTLYKRRFNFFTGKTISREPLYLQSKYNFCPNCKKFQLEFNQGGFFD